MSKIAVTGGAGFIGSNLVKYLVEDNVEVVVLDDLSSGLKTNINLEDIEFHEINILDKSNVNKILKKCDVIFHLAARGSIPRSIKNPLKTFEINTIGTLNILEIARETGAHIIFSSSSSVFGGNDEIPKQEKMWLSPLNPYAASKLSSEAFLSAYFGSYDVHSTVFRFFNVFGPNQLPNHDYAAVIPKWIFNAINNRKIEVYGDGNQFRDFTYVETVVKVLIETAYKKKYSKFPINLAFGNKISLKNIIDLLTERFGNLNVEYLSPRTGDTKFSQNDPRLIKTLFPNVTPIEFNYALDCTIEWILKNNEILIQ